MRIIFYALSVFLIFLSYNQYVSADSFHPSSDTRNCEMIGVMGIGYTQNLSNQIQYDEPSILGERTNWISSHKFTDVATFQYPNAHRFNNKADFVAVPPNTDVSFGAWFYNYSGHDIKVSEITAFTSRSNLNNGDLTNLGAGGVSRRLSFFLDGTLYERVSKSFQTGWGYTYKNGIDNVGQIFYTFKTIQPITINESSSSYEFMGEELVVNYKIVLKNNSKYNLCNIEVLDTLESNEEYFSTNCINSLGEKEITYSENLGNRYPTIINNNNVLISDKNIHTESITSVQSSLLDRTFETVPFVFGRNDSTNTGWLGYQPAWGEEGRSISVKLIPYSISHSFSPIKIEQNLDYKLDFFDEDEINSEVITTGSPNNVAANLYVNNWGGSVENISVVYRYDSNYFKEPEHSDFVIPLLYHNEDRSLDQAFYVREDLEEGEFNTTIQVDVVLENKIVFTKLQNIKIISKSDLKLNNEIVDYDGQLTKEKILIGGYSDISNRVNEYETSVVNDGNAMVKNLTLIHSIENLLPKGIVSNISDNGQLIADQSVIIWNFPVLNSFSEKIFSYIFEYENASLFEGDLETIATLVRQDQQLVDKNITYVLAPNVEIEFSSKEIVLIENNATSLFLTLKNKGGVNASNLEPLVSGINSFEYRFLDEVVFPLDIEDRIEYVFHLVFFDTSNNYYEQKPLLFQIVQNGNILTGIEISVTHSPQPEIVNTNLVPTEEPVIENELPLGVENKEENDKNSLIKYQSKIMQNKSNKVVALPKTLTQSVKSAKDEIFCSPSVITKTTAPTEKSRITYPYHLLLLLLLSTLLFFLLWLKKERYCSINHEQE